MAIYLFGGSPADIVYLAPGDDGTQRIAPNAVVTFWDNATEGTQQTVSLTSDGSSPQSSISADNHGRLPQFYGPDGFTVLYLDSGEDDRYVLTSTDLGSLLNDKLDKDEEPAHHIHTVSDIAGLTQTGATGLVEIDFNTATATWPKPAVLPTSRIIFFPASTNPALPPTWARPGYDVYFGPVAGATAVPDPTPDPTPDPDPVTGVTMTVPVVSGSSTAPTLAATLTTTDSQRFAYVQIAVRGPNGQNKDTAVQAGVTVDGPLDLSGTFAPDVSGSWQAYLTYNITGGTDQGSWIDGPKKTFTITLPTTNPGGGSRLSASPTGRTVPLMGLSGLGWNSGCFTPNQWDQSSTAAFSAYRGKTVDCRLVFAVHDGSTFDQMTTVPTQWRNYAGITIISIGPQPQPANNTATAQGSNNAGWETYGSRLTAAGMNTNRTIIRLGWETNAGGYAWSMNKPNAATYVAAFKNVVTSVRRNAPNVLFDLNFNKDYNSQGGMTWTQVADALHGYVDIISGDFYDWYDGWKNSASRETTWQNKPGAQRLTLAAYCRANGYYMGFPEWALVSATSGAGDGTGGGDDALYITETFKFFTDNADILGYECYYNDPGAPAVNQHELFRYPSSEAAYRSHLRWGNQ